MKLIILDRDGVINEDSDDYIKSPEEWRPIPGSLDAIARLTRAGYRIAVATNQSGVARGLFDGDTLQRIHDKMRGAVAATGGEIAAIFFCPHGPDAGCACRKPQPGLLREIGAHFNVDLTGVPAVGDSLRDIQAARAVGARPILVRTGKGEGTVRRGEGLAGVAVYPDLAAAVDSLLREAADPAGRS
ncbi:MAG: D-glycero-beta-D-manno-heptose 1,7-bisphosphate 7-phosphatase [Gammaproteobacteria bacterium]|jgi:D-glycero-D-manno-heptose 1,7-bisphosphate phosphatase